jgi:hypothetical protein
METKNRKIEEFKLALVKNIEEAIKTGLDAEDIIGTLENVKMITYGMSRIEMPRTEDTDTKIGYR